MKKSVFLLTLVYCIVSMRGIEAMQMTTDPAAFKSEEQNFQRNGITISGELFIPERTSPMPLVILSHGLTLIIHGTADSIAPISYSERAVTVFPHAELIKINGANHGFYGNTMRQAAQTAVQFVQRIIGEKKR